MAPTCYCSEFTKGCKHQYILDWLSIYIGQYIWKQNSKMWQSYSNYFFSILLIGRQKNLMILLLLITFSWTLPTMPWESGSVLTIHAIGHLFLPVSSFSNTASPTWKFLLVIFHFCLAWRFWRNYFCQWDQNSPGISCTCLHHLCEYRSGLLNTPGGGMINITFHDKEIAWWQWNNFTKGFYC